MADAFTKHLANLGFTAVALPNSVFGPLSLVYEYHGRRGWSNDFGALVQGATNAVPAVSPPIGYPDLSGKVIHSSDVKGALSILSGLIGALGGGTLGLKGGFESASTIEFEYSQVTMTEVSPVTLEQFLQSGAPPSMDGLLGRYLDDHLFVATRVLRSREFTVSAKRSSGQSIGLDVPVIKNAVGAKIDVEVKDESNTKIAFKGNQDVSFAFDAFWIRVKKGAGGKQVMYLQPTKPGGPSTVKAQFAAAGVAVPSLFAGAGAALNLANANIGLA
jgi:hypothetical protein